MSISVTPIANTDTFEVWLNRTNDLITLISNNTVTANGAVNGSQTSGNAWVVGTLGGTVLAANNIRGGTVETTNTLYVTSNLVVNSSKLQVGANVIVNTSSLSIGGSNESYVNVVTSGTSAQLIDSFDITTHRSAEYCLTIKNTAANGYQMSKLLLIHDDTDALVTEYGIIFSNTSLGVFSANANSTHVKLNFTPVPSATTVKGQKVLTVL